MKLIIFGLDQYRAMALLLLGQHGLITEINYPIKNKLSGLTTVYLGTEYNNDEIKHSISKSKLSDNFYIIDNFNSSDVADWIDKGI